MQTAKLSLFVAAFAISTPAIAEISFKQNGEHQTIEVSGLYDDASCSKRQFTGRVISREFDNDSVTLNGYVIEKADGTRSFINVSVPSGLDMATRSGIYDGLQRLTKPGRKVSGNVLACGAAGRVLNLLELR